MTKNFEIIFVVHIIFLLKVTDESFWSDICKMEKIGLFCKNVQERVDGLYLAWHNNTLIFYEATEMFLSFPIQSPEGQPLTSAFVF